MKNIKIYIGLLIAAFFVQNSVIAQNNQDWYAERIVGKRFNNSYFFDGSQYVIEDWVKGTLFFENGEKQSDVNMRYNSFLDQLIYFNSRASAEILIDKNTITGFSYEYNSKTYFYKKYNFDNLSKIYLLPLKEGTIYFEVIYDGFVDFLCFRKTEMLPCPTYISFSGSEKNQKFVHSYRFYFHHPEKGIFSTKIKRSALLSTYSKKDKKEIRKLLRDNNLVISNEYEFGSALKVIESAGFKMDL